MPIDMRILLSMVLLAGLAGCPPPPNPNQYLMLNAHLNTDAETKAVIADFEAQADKTCRSYGFKLRAADYNACRQNLDDQRRQADLTMMNMLPAPPQIVIIEPERPLFPEPMWRPIIQ